MKLRILTSYLLISCSWLTPLHGASTEEQQPVLYYADTQTHDRELGILILKGDVEFNHKGNILEADCVTYNENTEIVTASGNVRLRQSNGEVSFASYLELTGDMKEGVALQLRILLEDESKVAATEGRKFENRQELDQVVYTPCDFCGDQLPTWQINSRHAVKDDVSKDFVFTDAEFRFLNVPLMYLPYASQPQERRSGFLPELPSSSSDFGAIFKFPYHWVISEDIDLTITPVVFTKNHPMLIGEYRRAFGDGKLYTEGSIADYKRSFGERKRKENIPQVRGHIFGSYEKNFNEIWRMEVEGGYVSDKTYFRKYKFLDWRRENALTSKFILEGFLNQRDYAAVKAYHFQGLRVEQDHQSHISAPLPIVEYSVYSDTDPLGGRFKFDGNLLNLYRQKGLTMQRGIGEVGWQRPWNTSWGQVFTVFASVRGDLYNVQHGDHGENIFSTRHDHEKESSARFFPQSGLNWRWPFINSWCGQSVVVQPVAQLILAPTHALGSSSRKVPNEDSQDPEFNDANLFSRDRFPGYDRIDTGSRIVYGGEMLATGCLFGDIDVFFGQSYALSNHETGRNRRHLSLQDSKHVASDYVGRVEASPYDWLTLNYRFRLDQKTFRSRIAEVGGSLGPAIAKFSGNYLFISRHLGTRGQGNFSQLNLAFSSQFAEHWTLKANLIKDFKNNTVNDKGEKIHHHNGILSQGVGLEYKDNCFSMEVSVARENYKTRDVRPATVFSVSIWLKNIGDYSYSGNPFEVLFGKEKEKDKGK